MTPSSLARALARAAGVPCPRNYVYRWEKGTRKPGWWSPWLEQVLSITLDGVATGTLPHTDGITEPEVPPVDRRQFIGSGAVIGASLLMPPATARGRRIGMSDVDRYSQRITDLRRLDDFSGGRSVYPLVAEEIRSLGGVASTGSYTQEVGRHLLSALAELYQFASWTAFDSGNVGQAKRLAVAAANAANQAGNRTLGATALSELSYLASSHDRTSEGVTMARASLANAPKDVLPAVKVVLADRLAFASARIGDTHGVDEALGISNDAHDSRRPGEIEEPDTVYWINRDESKILAGRCWNEVGQHERAAKTLESLALPYDETHAREVGLYTCWLAESHLGSGNLDAAAEKAKTAIRLSHSTASPRLDDRLNLMIERFQPHRKSRPISELFAEQSD